MNLLVTDPASLGAAMVAATLRQRAEQKLVPAQRRLAKTLLANGRQAIDIRDCLAAPKIPVKVVFGAEDRITPARHAENLGGAGGGAPVPENRPHAAFRGAARGGETDRGTGAGGGAGLRQ